MNNLPAVPPFNSPADRTARGAFSAKKTLDALIRKLSLTVGRAVDFYSGALPGGTDGIAVSWSESHPYSAAAAGCGEYTVRLDGRSSSDNVGFMDAAHRLLLMLPTGPFEVAGIAFEQLEMTRKCSFSPIKYCGVATTAFTAELQLKIDLGNSFFGVATPENATFAIQPEICEVERAVLKWLENTLNLEENETIFHHSIAHRDGMGAALRLQSLANDPEPGSVEYGFDFFVRDETPEKVHATFQQLCRAMPVRKAISMELPGVDEPVEFAALWSGERAEFHLESFDGNPAVLGTMPIKVLCRAHRTQARARERT